MNLRDVVAGLDSTDDDLTIYADRSSGWGPESRAIAVEDTSRTHDGLDYLLEVHLANEVVAVWREWREGRNPSVEEKCEAIVWYAEHDAYLPVVSGGS